MGKNARKRKEQKRLKVEVRAIDPQVLLDRRVAQILYGGRAFVEMNRAQRRASR
jgi:hypothetical protein